ncbi:MAG: hypothetical protein HY776_01915 [Actinobacteria bacterium]|nr:hypothetical protein [Actinomycetota bacterium]
MKENKWRIIKTMQLLFLICVFVLLSTQAAVADTHSNQSLNVVIIGGSTLDVTDGWNWTAANVMGSTGGGYLPVTGPVGELGDFNFTPMESSDVSAANLAVFDTAVLNVSSAGMAGTTSTLTVSQKTDLVAFVGAGKKLIIYDSESPPVDYNWLPYPFTTSNPGAMGAQGTLTIVEENTLSSNNPADPHFVNAVDLSNNTDAVGDMNVMTTYDPNWFLDMTGTNYLGVTGPVHTYAEYSTGGPNKGLMIYNGLDQDYQWFSNANLRKIWVQELQQPFNPSNLPGSTPVVDVITNTPGRIVGWGGYNNTSFFNFNILSNGKYPVGTFYYSDRAKGLNVWSNVITHLMVSPDKKKAAFKGNVKIGGVAGYKFVVYVDDNGNPGINDKFRINIYDPSNALFYSSNGTLFTGNIQIYP